MNIYSPDGGPLVRNGRLNLAPEVAARLGIPSNLETWRYEISCGAMDPVGYQAALKQAGNADLHASATMLDTVEAVARRNPGIVVPLDLDADFHAILDKLRALIQSEAASRNVTLLPWRSVGEVQ